MNVPRPKKNYETGGLIDLLGIIRALTLFSFSLGAAVWGFQGIESTDLSQEAKLVQAAPGGMPDTNWSFSFEQEVFAAKAKVVDGGSRFWPCTVSSPPQLAVDGSVCLPSRLFRPPQCV